MIDPLQGWRSQATTRSADTHSSSHSSREHRAPPRTQPGTQRPQSSFAAAAGSAGAAAAAAATPAAPAATPASGAAAANRSAASGSRRGRDELLPLSTPLLPPAFICPITQELMEEPVVTQDGQTYERHAIEYWLRDHDTSPLTGQPLAHKELTANIVLRSMIREHYERQPEAGLR